MVEHCTIRFKRNKAEYALSYPYCLEHNTFPKLRKLFEAMCFEYWREENSRAIKKTNATINTLLCELQPHTKQYIRMQKVRGYFIKTVEKFGITHLLTE